MSGLHCLHAELQKEPGWREKKGHALMRALKVWNVVSLLWENWRGLALAPRCERVNEIIMFYQITQVFQTPFDIAQYRSRLHGGDGLLSPLNWIRRLAGFI